MNTFNHFSGNYLNIDGAKIYYEEAGNKNKPVLFMMHGGFENIENLNPLAAYLINDFCIIGMDTRGHGKSTSGTDKLSYERIQLDAEGILNHLKIKTTSILGFSDGGIVGYRLAAAKKVNVNKLITIGASWCENDITLAEDILKSITPESAKEYFPKDVEMYFALNPEPDFEQFTELVVNMWTDKTESGHPGENVQHIEAETLILRGEDDFLVSLESLVELKKRIKKSLLANIPFAGHQVYPEQPQITESIIKQFLCG